MSYELAPKNPGPEYFVVPYCRDSGFVGRTKELDAVTNALDVNTKAIIGGEQGMGKTALALEMAYRVSNGYDAILWFDCREPLAEQHMKAARNIRINQRAKGLPASKTDDLTTINSALQGKKSLLIFDHATAKITDNPLAFSTEGRHVLITTRDSRMHPGVILGSLEPEEGAQLILLHAANDIEVSRQDPQDRLAALKLSAMLNNNPYWLARAGANLEETGGYVGDLVEDLRTEPEYTMERLRRQEILGGIND